MLKNNTSDKVLVTGEDYKIERYIDSNWEEIPNKFFVHSIGLIIIPDKSNEISCQITDIGKTLDKGKYRIKKVVEVYNLIEIVTIPNSNGTVDEIPRYDMKNETPDKVNVYAEFTVE